MSDLDDYRKSVVTYNRVNDERLNKEPAKGNVRGQTTDVAGQTNEPNRLSLQRHSH